MVVEIRKMAIQRRKVATAMVTVTVTVIATVMGIAMDILTATGKIKRIKPHISAVASNRRISTNSLMNKIVIMNRRQNPRSK